MRSTPVRAMSRTRSRSTPPETSSSARPPVIVYGAAHVVEREVVEQHAGRAAGQRLLPARRATRLRSAPSRRHSAPRAASSAACDAAGCGDVVLLDQDAVPQRQALVAPAADTHRVLLGLAQSGQRLARVEDRAAVRVRRQAGDGFDIGGASSSPRRTSSAGNSTPLRSARQQRACVAVDAADLGAGARWAAFGCRATAGRGGHRARGCRRRTSAGRTAPPTPWRPRARSRVGPSGTSSAVQSARPMSSASASRTLRASGFVDGFVVIGHRRILRPPLYNRQTCRTGILHHGHPQLADPRSTRQRAR